jgi:hypothetical protein
MPMALAKNRGPPCPCMRTANLRAPTDMARGARLAAPHSHQPFQSCQATPLRIGSRGVCRQTAREGQALTATPPSAPRTMALYHTELEAPTVTSPMTMPEGATQALLPSLGVSHLTGATGWCRLTAARGGGSAGVSALPAGPDHLLPPSALARRSLISS